MVWNEGSVFRGATPSSPLNKLALWIGDTLPHNGMQVCSQYRLHAVQKGCVLNSVLDLDLEEHGWSMWRLQTQGPFLALSTALQDLA